MASEWDGVPENPDKDGWHWVCSKPMAWLADWQQWSTPAAYISPDFMSERAKVLGAYEGALRTPTQHAADLAAARRDGAEVSAQVCEGPAAADILLAAGEMSADTLRTIKIILSWRAAAIRARGGSDGQS